ncbi:MAG: hypothetical protein AAB285_00510, partial [candidate division NC10 bacterium]
MTPLALELGLAFLILAVFTGGLLVSGESRRSAGGVSAAGTLGLLVGSFFLEPGGRLFGGAFVM